MPDGEGLRITADDLALETETGTLDDGINTVRELVERRFAGNLQHAERSTRRARPVAQRERTDESCTDLRTVSG